MINSDKKHYVVFGTLALLILLLVAANLFLGSVNIPAQDVWRILGGEEAEKASWTYIVWESRFPQCVTALLCGAALSASGLMLQTVFSNPLADSSILGISSGASLGVALVMLAGGGTIATGVFTNHCHGGVYVFWFLFRHSGSFPWSRRGFSSYFVFILFDKK